MKHMTNFRLFFGYLHRKGATYEDLAEKLGMSVSSVKNWAAKGFSSSKQNPQDLTYYLFEYYGESDEKATIRGFFSYLSEKGYSVPNTLIFDPDRDMFEDFFSSFIYEKVINKTPDTVSAYRPTEKIINDSDDYFSQTVFHSENSTEFFSIKNADFSQLKKERLILIEGEGGQGKSTFIKKLNSLKKGQTEFKNVIIVSLAGFVDYLNKKNIQSVANNCTYIASYISSNDLSPVDLESIFCEDGESTLLLLDGFNEAYAFSNATNRNKVINELEDIKKRYKNIYFVVTTRPSEGAYSFKDCDFVKDFKVYYLSGVSDEMYQKFIAEHKSLPKEILEIAKIPLYFKALNKSNNLSKIKTRNDILREIYYQNYKQASEKPGANNAYFAYYLLAPAVANYMSENRQPYIDVDQIQCIARELFDEKNKSIALLHAIASKECPTSDLPLNNNIDAICNSLIKNGPLEPVENNDFSTSYRFFHDEIRKYLLAYYSWMMLMAIKLALLKKNHPYTKRIAPNLNLELDAINLLKTRLNLVSDNADHICTHISDFFNVEDFGFENLPWQIKFYHIVFLFSEYLGFKDASYRNTFQKILEPIYKTITIIYNGENSELYFDNIDENSKLDVESKIVDILCKECEFFRRKSLFSHGDSCIEIASKIDKTNDSVINQQAKINLAKFETSCPRSQYYKTTFGDAIDKTSFDLGLSELKTAADDGFILSSNLLSLIYAAPNPIILYANPSFRIDYVESFYILYSTIIKAISKKLYAHEIDYSIRQAVSLLLKGYVRIRTDVIFYKGVILSKKDFVVGEYKTFSIDGETIKLAKFLMEYADGLYRPSLDYLRAIIKIYEKKPKEAESLLNNEKSLILNKIVLNYKFRSKYNIDEAIQDALKSINKNHFGLDICHPIYWALIDPMYLETSLNPARKEFYHKIIEELDDTCKQAVKLSIR